MSEYITLNPQNGDLLSLKFKNNLLPEKAPPITLWYQKSRLPLTGVIALLAYVIASLLIDPIASYASSLLLLLGFGGVFLVGHSLRSSAPLWMLFGAFGIAMLSWGLSLLHHPDWAESSPKVHRLTTWFQFIAVAWLLGGDTRRTLAVWGISALSLLFTPWVTGDGMQEWILGFQGRRIDFGINNAQHVAMLFAVVFLGFIAFSYRLLKPGNGRILRASIWSTGLILFGAVVVMTQTRSVWLGCAAAGIVYISVLTAWLFHMPSSRSRAKIISITLSAVVCISSLAAATLSNVIERRLGAESTTIQQLFSEATIGNKSTSISYRIASWKAAIPWIQERPFIGWGGNGRGLVLDHSEMLPSWIEPQTGHLHSSYMDTLVNFGTLGLALFLWILAWTSVYSFKAWRRGFMPGDVLTFYLAFIAFWLVINAFESFMFYSTGQYAFSLIVGGVATHIWRMQVNDNDKIEKEKLSAKPIF